MGLDYFIRIDCPIQEPRTDVEFVQRAKVRTYAALCYAQAGQSGEKPKGIVTPFPVKTLMGARTNFTCEEMIDTWERIERKTSPFCRDCGVNLDSTAFGCWGSISYPISQAGERWLIENLKPSGPSYLVHHIKENGVDGRSLDSQRAQISPHPDGGAMLSVLLLPGPAERIIDDERITSSMIIQYLLDCQPYLMPITLLGLLDDYAAIEADSTTKMMIMTKMMMGNGDFQSEIMQTRFTLKTEPSDDKSVLQIKSFLKACYAVLSHGGRMMIDG